MTTYNIARHLKRSESAIRLKAFRLGLGAMLDNKDYLIQREVEGLLGVDRKTIKKKIEFEDKKLTKTKIVKTITCEKLLSWLNEHEDNWCATKVDMDGLVAIGYNKEKLILKFKIDKEKISRKSFSEYELSRLIMMYKRFNTYQEIADVLGKDYNAVKYKIYTMIKIGKLEQNTKAGRMVRNINRKNYGWEEWQDSKLIELFKNGKTLKEISVIVGKSLGATKSRNQMLSKRMIEGLSV